MRREYVRVCGEKIGGEADSDGKEILVSSLLRSKAIVYCLVL